MTEPTERERELAATVRKLEKINKVLMGRVERGMEMQGGAFSLFQAATALEKEVQTRTAALKATLHELERSNPRAHRGQGGCRRCEPRQVRVPGQHEP